MKRNNLSIINEYNLRRMQSNQRVAKAYDSIGCIQINTVFFGYIIKLCFKYECQLSISIALINANFITFFVLRLRN